jgi:glycosyltransferase involved in cell wall biosynthesis
VRTQHFIVPASAARRGWRRFASLALHRALNADLAALVAVSESVADAVRSRREVRPERVEVIAPGIELPDDDAVERAVAARRTAERPTIVCLSRLEREKSLPLLLASLPLLLERIPDVRLVVAGTGSLHAELHELTFRLGVARAVEWRGHVEDPGALLAQAHVYAHPAEAESFGLATAEAAAWALPVVGRRAGGTAEIVEDNVSGLLVESGEPASFAEALATLLENPGVAERMGRAGRARAVALYGADRTADRTLELYERISAR